MLINKAGWYYGYLDKIEKVDNKFMFYFDVITLEWFESNDLRLIDELILEYLTELFYLEATANQMKDYFPYYNYEYLENRWFRIYLGDKGLKINRYLEDIDEPIIGFISSIELLNNKTKRNKNILARIKSVFNLSEFNELKENEIENIFNKDLIDEFSFVSVYDVGQGGSNGFCNSRSMPLMYYDLGGGYGPNKQTYPTNSTKRFCTTTNPPVILSHWDQDHFESAKRLQNLTKLTWIAPNQQIGPIHLKFANTINKNGKLYIWPNNLNLAIPRFGEIVHCNGFNSKKNKKNNTGLAIIISLQNNNGNFKVLLPGDASFNYIPNIANHKYNGLVAFHHGASIPKGCIIPRAYTPFQISYSYGSNNTHHHPAAVTNYTAAGWIDRRDTVNGNIAFIIFSLPQLACLGSNCELEIKQKF